MAGPLLPPPVPAATPDLTQKSADFNDILGSFGSRNRTRRGVSSKTTMLRERRNDVQRALRPDKLAVAALEGTLAALHAGPDEVPVLRMAGEDVEAVRARAERLAAATGGDVEATTARVGGGALPLAELASFACALPAELAAPLRLGEPPVVGIVRDDRLLLDCRTLSDTEAEEAATAVAACRSR